MITTSGRQRSAPPRSMTGDTSPPTSVERGSSSRLGLLLAAAMFVLVVDTSLMNVSISAVVKDLDTTVSGVQSAIALEALVSAAFILISSKVGDLIGRKRAYVLGLLAYAIGALAMTLAQNLTTIIIFWAIIGGLGASLLLPAMQSLIHGNFEGAARKKTYALVGAAAAIAAAVGPLLGGFVTTYLSWRVGFLLEVVVIAVVLANIRLVRDVPYTGPSTDRPGRRRPLGRGHGRRRPRHPGLAGGRRGRGCAHRARSRRARRAGVLAGAPQASGEADLARPGPLPLPALQDRDLAADAAADHPRWRDDRASDLPADDARVRRDGGRAVPRPALAQHVRRGHVCRTEVRKTSRQHRRPRGVRAHDAGDGPGDPAGPSSRLRLVADRPPAPGGLGSGPAGVPAQQLHAGAHRGGAGQRGGRGELGRGVVRAVLRPGGGRRSDAGGALAELQQHDRGEHGHPA